MSKVGLSQSVTKDFRVKDADGALVDADSTPTAVLYRNGAATAVSVNVVSITGTGKYSASWTHASYTAGDQLSLEVTATVSGTAYTAVVWEGHVEHLIASALSELPANSIPAGVLTSGARDEIGTSVWASTTRTLSSFGTLIADIWANATRTLTSAAVFTVNGPSFDSADRLELIRATDYVDADGFAITVNLTTDLTLTGATITWTARHKQHPDQVITGTGSVVSATAPKSVKIEATATEIAKRPGIYGITIFAQPNETTRKVGVANGDLILEDDWGSTTY